MHLKVVPKPACDFENCSESRRWMYTRKNWPMRAKESLNRNLMRPSEQLLELVFSKKQAKTSYWFFSRTKQAKHLKTICACQESTDLILKAFKQIFNWWHLKPEHCCKAYQVEQHEHPLLLIHVVSELGGEGGRVGLHVGQQEPVHLLAAGGQGRQRHRQGRHQGGDRLRAAQAGEPTGGQTEIIYILRIYPWHQHHVNVPLKLPSRLSTVLRLWGRYGIP